MRQDKYDLDIRQMSASAILIQWPQRMDEDVLEDIMWVHARMRAYYGKQVVDYTPAFASLLIRYRTDIVDLSARIKEILYLYDQGRKAEETTPHHWTIPVCYDMTLGTDIEVYRQKGLNPQQVAQIHSEGQYRVYMIGFLPGFCYLGGLPEALHLPRRSTPRQYTPAGSVAIGGAQTGIYPLDSPGGWHVIGRTPLRFYDFSSQGPTMMRQGDYVTFSSISLEEYKNLM